MKNVLVLSLFAFLPLLLNAQSEAPAKAVQTTLADELSGEYIGTFARNGVVQEHVTIKVTRKGQDKVKISGGSGIKLKTFKANLSNADLSTTRRIKLAAGKKIQIKEGMMTPVNGRLSFAVSYPNGTLDVFSGIRASISQ